MQGESDAGEVMPTLDLPTADDVFRNVLAAGVAVDKVLVPWLDVALEAGGLAGLRGVVEYCAPALGLGELQSGWSFGDVLGRSAVLRRSLQFGHFLRLDDLLVSAQQDLDADSVLVQASGVFPAMSGPVLRRAQRLFDRGDSAAAGQLLLDFHGQRPNDVYVALLYARFAVVSQLLDATRAVLARCAAAGGAGATLIGPWLDACFRLSDASGARAAVEACAASLGVAGLPADWTWQHLLETCAPMRQVLHITHFYALDAELAGNGDTDAASAVLRQAEIAFPAYSGPVLKLAERALAAGDVAAAGQTLMAFLQRVPTDLHAAVRYAHLPVTPDGEPARLRVLGACLRSGGDARAILAAWIESCFAASDMAAARRAVETAAQALGLPELVPGWAWPDVLARSADLRQALHLTHFLFIDADLLARHDRVGADQTLRLAIEACPGQSAPVLRLAQRCEARGAVTDAESLMADFVSRTRGDVQAEFYASRLAQRVLTPGRRQPFAEAPEGLDRRLGLARKWARAARHGERGKRLLLDLNDRFALAFQAGDADVLPALFARHALDQKSLLQLIAGLAAPPGQTPLALPATPEFGFVRGAIACSQHDFATAQSELDTYARRYPDSEAGLAARAVVDYLDIYPFANAEFAALVQRPAAWPELSAYAGRHLLILSDQQTDQVEALLAQLPPDCRATVCFTDARDHSRVPTDSERFRFATPDFYYWFTPEGGREHRRLEAIVALIVDEAQRQIPRFGRIPWALGTNIIDNNLYDYSAMIRFAGEAASGAHDAALIATRHYSTFATARGIAAVVGQPHAIDIAWTARPAVAPVPGFVFWPDASVRAQLYLRQRVRRQADPRLGRQIVPRLPVARPPLRPVKVAPALVAWGIGTEHFDFALSRLLGRLLEHRPVILVVEGDTEDRVAKLADIAAPMVRRSGHAVQILGYDTMLRLGRLSPAKPHVEIGRIARAVAVKVDVSGTFGPVDIAYASQELSSTSSRSAHIDAFAAAVDWLDCLFATLTPAYVITAPGRSSFLGLMAEYAKSAGVETLDLFMYFIAQSARQLQPPHRFVATIDSMLEDFVVDFWNIGRERLLRVGYVWQKPRARQASAALPAAAEPMLRFGKVILLATQPSPLTLSGEFFETFLRIVATLPDTGAWIKPHPRESPEALALYASLTQAHGLGDRVAIFSARDAIDPFIAQADLIITRYSNVALEAAQLYKPVVRAIFLDGLFPKALMHPPYAFNSETAGQMAEHMRALLHSDEARQRLKHQQTVYFAENPALVHDDGIERLLAFMEGLVAKNTANPA